EALYNKTPLDGLCGKTDEESCGFTYAVLDRYIREGVCEDADVKAAIDKRHAANLFKLYPMNKFEPV
ncbi:MAG: NAD(+) synthase, partial [Lachnospiraceae bacterium]|nr:NAD(+) synthase [Lachnospiraceae bacterium]